MIVTNKRKMATLKMETVYFAECPDSYQSNSDIVLFYSMEKNPEIGRVFKTLRLDLTQPSDAIFESFDKDTRRRIRKAQRAEEFILSDYPKADDACIGLFCDNYDDFAASIGIPLGDREFLQRMRDQGTLDITLVHDTSGNCLCGIADIHDERIVMGMYTFNHYRRFEDSASRNRSSDANRYMIWHLIEANKAKGYLIRDFGGLKKEEGCPGDDPVDRFKMCFGGTMETCYHFYQARSLKGKLALKLTKMNDKIEY